MLNSQLKVWEFARDALANKSQCVMLLVTNHQGSSPGRTGFKMAIDSSGKMAGSIGGGIMEHKLVELSKNWLSEHIDKIKIVRQIHAAEAGQDRSGMICSGEQTVAMISLFPNSLSMIEQILKASSNLNKQVLSLSPAGISLKNQPDNWANSFEYLNDGNWEYKEQLNQIYCLHIVGGGHISLALSKLANDLDFQVNVYDHRKNLPTVLANNFAQSFKLVRYQDLNKLIPSGALHFVVIMTFGYRTDLLAIQNIVTGDYGYLGLLGSKAKVAELLNQLIESGYDNKDLSKIDAPAGLKISSQTPMEIAVSIAASLVERRSILRKSKWA